MFHFVSISFLLLAMLCSNFSFAFSYIPSVFSPRRSLFCIPTSASSPYLSAICPFCLPYLFPPLLPMTSPLSTNHAFPCLPYPCLSLPLLPMSCFTSHTYVIHYLYYPCLSLLLLPMSSPTSTTYVFNASTIHDSLYLSYSPRASLKCRCHLLPPSPRGANYTSTIVSGLFSSPFPSSFSVPLYQVFPSLPVVPLFLFSSLL